MTKTILMGVSVLALLAAFPAFAETNAAPNKVEPSVGQRLENAADTAGQKIENAAHEAKEATKNAYSDLKSYFNDDDDMTVGSVNVMQKNTADALIGTSVQDGNGKTLGTIHDIIVDAEGDAEWVIIEDGGTMGIGSKLAAFDNDIIEGYNKDKDVVVKLTEQQLKSAKKFDYKPQSGYTTVPAGQYSVSKLMDADVLGPDGKKVADVDTLAFEDDDAEYVIVTFNTVLGMGGDKAALNMDALDIITDQNGDYDFKLNQKQTAQFESYKDTKKSN
jgi:sporulation protein YlmC with PRC-barrel domain